MNGGMYDDDISYPYFGHQAFAHPDIFGWGVEMEVDTPGHGDPDWLMHEPFWLNPPGPYS